MTPVSDSGAPQGALVDFDEVRWCEVLVVGSGAAGLSAALAAAGSLDAGHEDPAGDPAEPSGEAGADVVLITKLALGAGGSTAWAQGGIAAAVGPGDSPRKHADDTTEVGVGLCDPRTVRDLTRRGPAAIRRLIGGGARFDRDADGELALGREGGHTRNRVLHAGGDRTGAEISRALVAAVAAHPGIRVEEGYFAADLLLWDGALGRRVTGLVGIQGGRRIAYVARAVVLACGGAGRLYSHTTNPAAVTGDGIAMAARAGALLADLEFFQFHPTALDRSATPDAAAPMADRGDVAAPLLTEALRGAGALLVCADGERFMPEVHELAELAPRDVVARTLWERREQGLASFLDLRPVIRAHGPLEQCFPTAAASCAEAGLDPSRDLVPVTPAAHYTMGGVWTDGDGRTSLPGLWAAGEVSSSGVHGANRLASNSLLEALVFGERVAKRAVAAEGFLARVPLSHLASRSLAAGEIDWSRADVAVERNPALRREIGDLMWRFAGLVRSAEGLSHAARRLAELEPRLAGVAGEERNLLLVARLLVAAAARRSESRGAHYRSDFPATDPAWARRSFATADELLVQTGRRRLVRPTAAPAGAGG